MRASLVDKPERKCVMSNYVQTAIRNLIEAEILLKSALKELSNARHLKSVDLHCKIIDIREIIEILEEE